MTGRLRSETRGSYLRTTFLVCACIVTLTGCDSLSDPPEYRQAIALRDQSIAIVQDLESVLQNTHTAKDFEANLPKIKQCFNDLLDKGNQIEDIISTLELNQRRELNRRLVRGGSLESAVNSAMAEFKRVCQIQGISMLVRMDLLHFGLDLKRRGDALTARSKANQAGTTPVGSKSGAPELSGGPNSVRVICKGQTPVNHLGIFEQIQEFNSGELRATNQTITMPDVQDFDGLVAALKERVGTVQEVNREARQITVLVDSAKIPAAAPIGRGLRHGFPTAGMPSGFGSSDGPAGGFGSGPVSSGRGKAKPRPFGTGGTPSGSAEPHGFGGGSTGAESDPPSGFGTSSEAAGGNSPFGSSESGFGGDPRHPESLIRRAQDKMAFDREDALRTLTTLDPTKSSAETRKKVALGLKAIAANQDGDDDERALAVEGMVIWAGKYAAPILLEILQGSENSIFNDKTNGTILRYLGELKVPDTLEPVVLGFANGSLDGDAAARCIIQFGPDAESLVLKNCRPGKVEHSRQVVYVLSKIGGKKSLNALRSLASTFEGRVLRNEIAQAAGEIKARMRESQGEEE